jgi:Velvet factor
VRFRFYSLEVSQQPIRARMCGFGDKVSSLSSMGTLISLGMHIQDRRPLAPAAVAKMIVRTEDNNIVHEESVFSLIQPLSSCSPSRSFTQ